MQCHINKEPINLSPYATLENKLLATNEYGKIREIYFEVNNPDDIGIMPPKLLNVTQMVTPPGSGII